MMHDGKRHDGLYVWLLNVDVMLDMKYGIYILCHGKNISDCNRTFAHSKFNKKNYRFIIRVISLTMSKMVPILERERAMEWTKNLSIIFLQFCRCLNFVKNQIIL
jgi:hypothetical protein